MISLLFDAFSAGVTLYESARVTVVPNARDTTSFPDVAALARYRHQYGYYGGIRLIEALLVRFPPLLRGARHHPAGASEHRTGSARSRPGWQTWAIDHATLVGTPADSGALGRSAAKPLMPCYCWPQDAVVVGAGC